MYKFNEFLSGFRISSVIKKTKNLYYFYTVQVLVFLKQLCFIRSLFLQEFPQSELHRKTAKAE